VYSSTAHGFQQSGQNTIVLPAEPRIEVQGFPRVARAKDEKCDQLSQGVMVGFRPCLSPVSPLSGSTDYPAVELTPSADGVEKAQRRLELRSAVYGTKSRVLYLSNDPKPV
jgi:hypothetical protein